MKENKLESELVYILSQRKNTWNLNKSLKTYFKGSHGTIESNRPFNKNSIDNHIEMERGSDLFQSCDKLVV